MKVPQLNVRQRRLALWLVATAVLGSIVGAWTVRAPGDSATVGAAQSIVAAATTVSAGASTASGRSAPSAQDFGRIWEITKINAAPPEKGKERRNWRLAGSLTVGNQTSVLVLYEGSSAPEAKKPGDLLPGGAKIISIQANEVLLAYRGQRVYLPIGRL